MADLRRPGHVPPAQARARGRRRQQPRPRELREILERAREVVVTKDGRPFAIMIGIDNDRPQRSAGSHDLRDAVASDLGRPGHGRRSDAGAQPAGGTEPGRRILTAVVQGAVTAAPLPARRPARARPGLRARVRATSLPCATLRPPLLQRRHDQGAVYSLISTK